MTILQTLALAVVLVAPVLAHADDDAKFAPLPGRDVVRPIKADWCDDAEVESWLSGDPSRAISAVGRTVDSGYSEKALNQIAQLGCIKPSDPDLQKAVAKYRQGYINLVGTTESEDRAAMKLRVSPRWNKQKQTHCDAVKPGGDEDSLEAKSFAEALSAGTGCAINGHGGMPLTVFADGLNKELGWWLDARAETSSEIVRAVYVTRCLRILRDDNDWPVAADTAVMQAFATCGPDARRLDRTKLDAELAKYPEFARINAREVFAQAKTIGDRLAAEYTALAAKDPGYKKLLFDAPESGWKSWEAAYAANKDGYEAALAYEKLVYGPSKNALRGCSDRLRKNFNAYIRGKAGGPDAARRAALDDMGYSMLTALAVCDGAEGRLQVSQTYVDFLTGEGEPPPNIRRGPRFAAYYAAAAALGEILADRSRFPIKTNEFFLRIDPPRDSMIEAARHYFTNKVVFEEEPKVTIAKLDKQPDGVLVSFKSISTTIPNRICTPNGRILRVGSDGRVIYDSDCVTKGTVTFTTTEKPLFVPAAVADGLAVNQVARFSVDGGRDGRSRNGVPKLVYDAKGKLVIWYGVRL